MTATILDWISFPSRKSLPVRCGPVSAMGQLLLAVTTSTLAATPTGFRSLALVERGDGDAEKTMDHGAIEKADLVIKFGMKHRVTGVLDAWSGDSGHSGSKFRPSGTFRCANCSRRPNFCWHELATDNPAIEEIKVERGMNRTLGRAVGLARLHSGSWVPAIRRRHREPRRQLADGPLMVIFRSAPQGVWEPWTAPRHTALLASFTEFTPSDNARGPPMFSNKYISMGVPLSRRGAAWRRQRHQQDQPNAA